MKDNFKEHDLKSFEPATPSNPDKLKSKILGKVNAELKKPVKKGFFRSNMILLLSSAAVVLICISLAIPSTLNSRSAESIDIGADHEINPAIAPQSTNSFGLLAIESENMRRNSAALGQGFVSQDLDTTVIEPPYNPVEPNGNEDEYGKWIENPFTKAITSPFSTFSIDVDTASYAIIRRSLMSRRLPVPDAVRIEEMINYFSYEYAQPSGDVPFSINTEFGPCPWNSKSRLVLVGIQGKSIESENAPPSNLVFLIDVSGSMSGEDRLPLLKSAFKMLVDSLRPVDRIAMVVYAGAAGLVLPSTSGDKKAEILEALDKLEAGGSTAGGAGIQLAYKVATDNFVKGGNNRVILATDGDFNVGVSDNTQLVKIIEEKRKSGVFLSVLGFGMGNYKDDRMEKLADNGNGNYAYIDSLREARKVLVSEMAGTLFAIAKDVKIQIEFNPAKVESYRLIGYENRMLNKEDFEDDTKDAGELGAGHFVTALYEVVLNESGTAVSTGSSYTTTTLTDEAIKSNELMKVRMRYKPLDSDKSLPIEQGVVYDERTIEETSSNFRWAAAVASFGLLLRESKYKADADLNLVLTLAQSALNFDPGAYRAEFIELVKICSQLKKDW